MSTVAWLQCAATAAINATFAWLTGVLFVRLWLGRGHPDFLLALDAPLRRSAAAAAVACLVASLGSLWAATALMGDTGLADALPLLPQVLTETAYGRGGLVGLAAMAALAVLHGWGRGRGQRPTAAVLLLGFALARASVSHAGEHGVFSAAYAIEVMHLLLTGVWLGGVALAALLVLPAAVRRSLALPAYLDALSLAATVALAGIVASGAFNCWQRLSSVSELATHPYGQALGWKLMLFALAASLGAYNRFAGFPMAATDGGRRALLVLRIEAAVLALVLFAAARLTTQQPPG